MFQRVVAAVYFSNTLAPRKERTTTTMMRKSNRYGVCEQGKRGGKESLVIVRNVVTWSTNCEGLVVYLYQRRQISAKGGSVG